MTTYNLFISHAWSYNEQYKNLENMLNQRSYFNYKNYSIPKDDPVHTNGTDRQLKEKITEQIRNCHVVLVLAGVYSTYSKWINVEIEVAKKEFSWEKPIIAIKPRGSERTSQHVNENADRIVGWNSDNIVDAIRELG